MNDIQNKNYNKSLKEEIEYAFVTGFYTGLIPYAPGTFASIYGMLIGLELLMHTNFATLIFTTYLFFLFGIISIEKYEKKYNIHDDPKTAIDEVIGILFAITMAYPLIDVNFKWKMGIELLSILVLFRYFDIRKPGIIGIIDKDVKGAVGTVLDDVIAGFYAAMVYSILKILIFS